MLAPLSTRTVVEEFNARLTGLRSPSGKNPTGAKLRAMAPIGSCVMSPATSKLDCRGATWVPAVTVVLPYMLFRVYCAKPPLKNAGGKTTWPALASEVAKVAAGNPLRAAIAPATALER